LRRLAGEEKVIGGLVREGRGAVVDDGVTIVF